MKRFGMLLLVGGVALFFLAPLTSFAERPSLCWLLDSPWRESLSSSGESALSAICTPQFSWAPTHKTATVAQNAQSWENIRVNDPSTDIPEQTTQSETTIALYKDTVLVAFVDTGQYLPATAGVSSLSGYARSEDGGQTFTDLGRVPPSSRSLGYSDPSLGVDSQGNFYFANLQFVPAQRSMLSFLGVAKSTNDGRTFAEPVLIGGPADVHFQDKELIAVDDTGGRFDGNVYMTWTEFDPDGPQILFVRSADGGRTFSAPIVLSDESSVQGATPAVGPNGEVYVIWLALSSGRSLRLRRSDDGGITFGPAVTVAPLARTFDPQATNACRRQALRGGIRTLELPSVAVDRSPTSFFRGAIYIAYQSDPDGPGPDMSDIFLVSSFDGGKTFSNPVRVNDDQTQTDQFMPAVAVAADGTVGVFFYDRRLDPDNLKIDVYFARSRDGGKSFEPNLRVTDVSFAVPPTFGQPTSSQNFDALRGICYMGDYNQMAADARFFYLAWGDNRTLLQTERYPNGRPDPDVFFAKIPVQVELK
ncbi:MAG: glycoside hydrolase [Candidatus Bipolaricaulota bacterium]|nr:glycoside hydrolase [Candidatus Bipolaricaulota bacterium]